MFPAYTTNNETSTRRLRKRAEQVFGPLDRHSHRRIRYNSGISHSLQSELELARRVQQRLLPQNLKRLETVRCFGTCAPAGQIGGDYYDFLDCGPDSLGFLVADVSGKGIAAALLVASLQASVRAECARGPREICAILKSVNAQFFASTLPEQYATMFFGRYDDRTRCLRFVNCGHAPGIVVREDGSVERLEATAPPLGMFGQWICEEKALSLRPNDTLCLCSDGIIEAGIETGDEFGEERLIATLRASRYRDIAVTVDRVINAVRAYRFTATSDDVTVVGIRSV